MSRVYFLSVFFAPLLLLGCTAVPEKPVNGTPDSVSPPTPTPASLPTPPVAQCDIQPAIQWMVSQRIIYAQNPNNEWRDCSGNFLRLSSRIATICDVEMVAPPNITQYVHGGNNNRPAPAQARTTRAIAKWYDQKGLFTPVYYDNTQLTQAPADLLKIRNKIKPGSVLWFARKQPVEAGGKSALHDERTGVINHMGTIISVTKDSASNVTGWKMYHGQNPKKHNEVTTHYWDWPTSLTSRGQKYPPGGYWSQRIVGFAEHIIP